MKLIYSIYTANFLAILYIGGGWRGGEGRVVVVHVNWKIAFQREILMFGGKKL